MEYIIIFSKLVLLAVGVKAITIGSNYNFPARLKYGSKYTKAYFDNKEKFKEEWS